MLRRKQKKVVVFMIHRAFKKYILSTYNAPGIVLGPENASVKKQRFLSIWSLHCIGEYRK